MRVRTFGLVLGAVTFFPGNLCFAQSSLNENPMAVGLTTAAPPVSDAVVSVQELKMSGKADSEFEKGTKLLLKGNARGSVAYFERAVTKDPGFYRGYHNLGLAEYRVGEMSKAAEAFQRAIDLTKGRYAPSEFALGMILLQQGQFRQAEGLIQHGLLMDPGSALGKYFLSLAQFALNRLPDAERSAYDALSRSAEQADAHILLAEIHERDHNPYAVEADVAAYLKLDPHGPLESVANVLLRRAQDEIKQQADASR